MTAYRITRTRLAICLAGVLVIATATVTMAAATRPTGPVWTPKQVIQYLPDSNHSQYDAVVVEGRQTWFFGGSNVTGRGVPEILYRNDGHWLPAPDWPPPPPIPVLHSWITAAGAISPDDLWIVTRLGGFVLFWDGGNWAQAHGGWDPHRQFTGITVVGLSNVWLFGSTSGGIAGAGTWHLTPAGWQQIGGAAANLNQASAAGPSDIWAIGGARGSMKLLAHFNGSVWTREQPRALAGFRYSNVVVLAADNVWVAGSVAGHPRLGHFNGHGWTSLAMPGAHAATGMCRDGRGGLWVIANSGTSPTFVRHRSAAGKWTRALVSSNPSDEILACALVPGRRAAWGAGMHAPLPGAKGTAAAAYGTGPVP